MRRYRALENRGPHDRAQAPAILGKFKKVCRVGRKPFPPLRTLSGALCPSALQTPLRSTCVPFRPPSDPGGSSPMRGAPCTEHHVYRRITAFSRPAPVGPRHRAGGDADRVHWRPGDRGGRRLIVKDLARPRLVVRMQAQAGLSIRVAQRAGSYNVFLLPASL